MNDRNQAIDILQRAREMLCDRLTDEILGAKDGLLEDAAGYSTAGEIGTLFEDVGGRLAHVSQMLGNLPPESELTSSEEDSETPGEEAADALEEPTEESQLALPSPEEVVSLPLALAPPEEDSEAGSWHAFMLAVEGGDLDGAGRVLADLLGLTDRRGRQCVEIFHQRVAQDSELVVKAFSLRHQVAGGSINGILQLLQECFGLQITESLAAVQTLLAQHG